MLEDLRWLSAGSACTPNSCRSAAAAGGPCRFAAGFLYLRHRRHGVCLFDTGYSDHFQTETRSFPNQLYARLMPPRFEGADRACEQLRRLGIAPQDVRSIIVSHFHADHIAGLRDFPKASIVCAEPAYAAMRGRAGCADCCRACFPG